MGIGSMFGMIRERSLLAGTQKIELAHDKLLSKPSDEGAQAALAAIDPFESEEGRSRARRHELEEEDLLEVQAA